MTKLLLIVSIILFIAYDSLSCSCYPISIKDNYNRSSFVFKGKVITLDTLKQYDKDLPKGAFRELHLATISVDKIYKGDHFIDTIRVVTGAGYGDCGYEFSVGVEYIVYAVNKNYEIIDSTILPSLDVIKSTRRLLYTDNCDRTTFEIEGEIQNLRKYLRKRKKRLYK